VSNEAAPTPAPTVPGAILAGKYRVERILGQGGMGVVVEARHIQLDDRVALKFLLPEYASHPEAKERFAREARNAVKIKSEHVARVSDVGTLDTGAPYMVMEFLEGRDLSGVLEKTGVLTVPDAIDYVVQACEAIAEAHSLGIVHRDIKPANFFLTKRADGSPLVKVLDFGISKSAGAGVDNLTKTTAAMGSALYMSPEQMQQTRSVDHRTDIYALGISLYELLGGKQPYYADTLPQLCAAILTGIPQPIRELRPDVSPELAAVMEKAYARDRAHRFQSVSEFVVALAPWAPSRTQPILERVARLGGLTYVPQPGTSGVFAAPQMQAYAPPQAPAYAHSQGYPAAPAVTPPGGYPVAPNPTGGQLIAEPLPIPPQAAPQPNATVPLPVMDPTAAAPRPPSNPNQIVPGPYQAPMSVRAAASFKQGAGGPVITGQPRSRVGLYAALAISVMALGGIGTAIAMRMGQKPHPTPTEPSAQPSAAPSAAPVAASATPSAVPSATPSAVPVTSSATPVASSAAPAVEPPRAKVPGAKTRASAAPTAAPVPGKGLGDLSETIYDGKKKAP
jgi:serine/threonine-protein kinase